MENLVDFQGVFVFRRVVISIVSLLFVIFTTSLSGNSAIEGYWKSVDDKTGKTSAFWKFTIVRGELHGYIVNYEDQKESDVCIKCNGAFKNKPIDTTPWIKLKTVTNKGKWEDGYIIDSRIGERYKCTIWVENRVLKVRGFIGIEALGRTQTWKRSSKTEADKGL